MYVKQVKYARKATLTIEKQMKKKKKIKHILKLSYDDKTYATICIFIQNKR